MSIESGDSPAPVATLGGAPELTTLGKRLELLRIERGLSKQLLAKLAGTSRQQLWRVMTGKSELTGALCQRLAEVLQIDARVLRDWCNGANTRLYPPGLSGDPPAPPSLDAYVAELAPIIATLQTLPSGESGRRLKRELLNCIEEVAAEAGLRLSAAFFELRGRVINGEL
jgi:transcriptional regulator with XRE-family HTH domain